MQVFKTRSGLRTYLSEQRRKQVQVGLVPTMGAIHQGHLSLVEHSKAENEVTVCSIFVNPTQFNDPEDLEKYPRPVESDIEQLNNTSCDALFLPSVKEMYPEKEHWQLDLEGLDILLEGKSRPGHYQGVTQIVKKLLDTVQPDRAYFGQKDYQQFLVISRMVRHFNLPVKLVCCPTVREADGLAMSSRNVHLSSGEREAAVLLSRTLFRIRESTKISPGKAARQGFQTLGQHPLITPEYLEVTDAETLQPVQDWNGAPRIIALAAARVGETRLIDNVFIRGGYYYY